MLWIYGNGKLVAEADDSEASYHFVDIPAFILTPGE